MTGATVNRRDGWYVVAALFVVLTLSSGFSFYNFSVYVNVFAEQRGFAVSGISGAVSLFFLVGGVAGVLVGRWLNAVDVRWLMIGGVLICAAALTGMGLAETLPWVYVWFVVFGCGNAAVSIVVSTTLITWWFPGRNRSIALSIASTGLSVGGVLITPASAVLLDRYAIPQVLPWFGVVFALCVIPTVLLAVRRPPQTSNPVRTAGFASAGTWDFATASRTGFYRLLTLGFLLCMAGQVGGIAHLYNRAEQIGSVESAAYTVQLLTIASITGRFVGGWLVMRLSIRAYTLGCLLLQGAGLGGIAAATTQSELYVCALLFGASVGNLLMLQPLWLAEAFDGTAYPRLFAWSNAVSVIGVAGGPLLLGVLYDADGYAVAYGAATLLSAAALIAILAAGHTPMTAEQPDSEEDDSVGQEVESSG